MRLSTAVSGAVMDFDPFGTRTEADSVHQFGSPVMTSHGRDMYRFGKASENTTRGKMKLAPSPIANHANQTIDSSSSASSVAVGSTRLTVDNGGTAATAGEYDEGWLIVNDVDGEGQTLGISHNAAAGTSADIVVDLDDPVFVALVAGTSQVTLVHNPYNGFQEAASKTLRGSGVSLRDILSGDYGWLKTSGTVSCLIGSAATLGARLTSDGSTDGAVTDNTDVTAPQAEVELASASIVAGVSTEFNPIVVTID